jgi:hypothetical protein
MLKHFSIVLLSLLVWAWSGYILKSEIREIQNDCVSSYTDHSLLPLAEIQSAEIDEQEEDHALSLGCSSSAHPFVQWFCCITKNTFQERSPLEGFDPVSLLLKNCCLLM